MNIGQLVYASTPEAGWRKTYSSGRVTREAESFFVSISSSSPDSDNVYAFDYKDGVYILSKTLVAGSDVFNRDTRLTHGYIFYEGDCEDIFNGFNRLLNITSFAKSHDEALCAMNELPDSEFSGNEYFKGMKGEPQKIIGCIFQAIITGQTMEIVLPSTDFNCVRAVMSVIYDYMPVSARKLITFASGNSGARYLISFVNKKTASDGIFYSLIDGSCGFMEKEYAYFCEEYIKKGEKFINEIEKLIKESEKRVGNTAKAVKEAFEKKMLKSGTTKIDSENLFVMFVELTSGNKYRDQIYAKKLCELLDLFIESKINISGSFGNLVSVYNNAEGTSLKKHICEFMAKTLVSFPETDFKTAVKTISASPGLRGNFVKLISVNEEYSSLLAKYLNLFFLDTDKKNDKEYDSAYKEAEKLLALYADADGISVFEILERLYETEPDKYKSIEKKIAGTEKSHIIGRFYVDCLLKKAENTETLKENVKRLESLEVSTDEFIKESMKKFVVMAVSEYGDNENIIKEAKNYAAHGGFDCKEYISDIISARNEEFWKNFSWKDFSFETDYSDKYDKNSKVSETVERLVAIGAALSRGKKRLCDTEPAYVELFASGEYIESTEDAVSVLNKLTYITKDYDVMLLYLYLSGRGSINRFAIEDADSFMKYVSSAIEEPDIHVIKYDKVRKTIYRKVTSSASDDNKYRKLLALLDEYELKLNEDFAKKNPIIAMFGKDTFRLRFTSAVICSCLMMILIRCMGATGYLTAIADSVITVINLVLVFSESIGPVSHMKEFIKKLGINLLIAAIVEILTIVLIIMCF